MKPRQPITVRIPEDLYAKIKEFASREGISINAWILSAISHKSTMTAYNLSESTKIVLCDAKECRDA